MPIRERGGIYTSKIERSYFHQTRLRFSSFLSSPSADYHKLWYSQSMSVIRANWAKMTICWRNFRKRDFDARSSFSLIWINFSHEDGKFKSFVENHYQKPRDHRNPIKLRWIREKTHKNHRKSWHVCGAKSWIFGTCEKTPKSGEKTQKSGEQTTKFCENTISKDARRNFAQFCLKIT